MDNRKWACAGGVPAGVAVWLLLAGPAGAATIGNVTSYTTAGQEVTFNISDGSKARIGILAADMARVRIAPSGTFGTNISRAVVTTSWPAAAFTVGEDASSVTITTGAMKLVVVKAPFVLQCRDLSNGLILADDATRRVQWESGYTRVYKTTQSGEQYVGLGWRTQGLVRNGTRFVMRNVPTYSDPTTFYSGVPLWYGLRNGSAYGVFFDDTSWGEVDLTTSGSGYVSFKNLGGTVDYYYFAGPTMSVILDRYTELTGRPFMPPRWACGYQQCRWSYWPKADLMRVANELRSRGIPCDVIYLDIDYMPGGHALTFDTGDYPDPAGMIATLHGQGYRVVANISPMLLVDDPKCATASSNGYLLKKADGTNLVGWHDYWYFVGGAGTGSIAWLDFSKTAACNWWKGQHTAFLSYGIDGIWNDLNEPDELGGAWPTDVKYNFDGSPVNHNQTSPQYSLLETSLSYQALSEYYPARRPFVLSRGGYAGIQRCSALWSGDNTGDWTNHYSQNIRMGLSMSICGNPFNGHDIGGFFGSPGLYDKISGELYARWMQAGVFNPFCRQHHTGEGVRTGTHPYVEPWEFGSTVETICRDFIRLRYRLMPYLYTLFHAAHAAGEPIQRPTLFDFPGDPATLTQDYDFMFGPSMLVSPVRTAGATTWSTYLPAGTDWINWWNDTRYTGGQSVNTSAPLAQLPIFVRGGAIIPMAPVSQYDGQTPIDVLTLRLYPVNQTSSFTLYEDDGLSWDYQSGEYAETAYTMQGIGDWFTLDIAARDGGYVPTARDYRLEIHRWGGHTRTATLNSVAMTEYFSQGAFDAAEEGYYFDTASDILYAKFADTGGHLVFTFGGIEIPDVPGDFNNDGDVDQEDFGFLQGCLTELGVQAEGDCTEADLDGNSFVDHQDVSLFEDCMSGAGIMGDPDCAG